MFKRTDPFLFYIFLTTIVFGVAALSSASLGFFSSSDLSPWKIVFGQVTKGFGLGLILFLVAFKTDYKFWRRHALLVFVGVFLVSLAVFLPEIGFSSGGARRWISWGPLFFQPSEFLKLGLIIYLASWMSSKNLPDLSTFKFGVLPFLVLTGMVGAIFIAQPDLGTLVVLAGTAILMFFISGAKKRYAVSILGVFAVSFILLVSFQPYRLERLTVFLDSSADPQGAGYQIKQSKIALGSGGVFGKGFGQGIQKFSYLPEPAGDAIFATIGEEFGFAGSSFVVIIFSAILWRGLYIMSRTSDRFGRLLGSGIVILITAQAFINMGALSGVVPLTGIPLPFISQGGSSLAALMAGMGIVLNISQYKK